MPIASIVERFSVLHPETPVKVAEDRGRIILSLSGSFDIKLAAEVEILLADVIDGAEIVHPLVLDLAAVNYISSSGVGALANALARARKRNLPFFVRNMTAKVRMVFDILGLLEFFVEECIDD
jgi:anti-sigma B factor antagonist